MAVATAMALWLAAAATLSLFPAAGLAQEAAAPGAVATIVETCVAQTPRGELAPECIGAASRQCQQSPDGEATLGITDCLMAEHAVWDAALNREYKTVRAMLADDDTASAASPSTANRRPNPQISDDKEFITPTS